MKVIEIALIESFDSNIKARLTRNTPEKFTLEADIGGRKIVFNAGKFAGLEHNMWEIEFTERTPGNVTFGKSGKGSEMQVFSFVLDAIRELVSRHAPDEIQFTSDTADGNRTRLYKKLFAREAPAGYHLASETKGTGYDLFSFWRDDFKK